MASKLWKKLSTEFCASRSGWRPRSKAKRSLTLGGESFITNASSALRSGESSRAISVAFSMSFRTSSAKIAEIAASTAISSSRSSASKSGSGP